MSEPEEVRRHRSVPPSWFPAVLGAVLLVIEVVVAIAVGPGALLINTLLAGAVAGFWFGIAAERSNARSR